MLTVERNPDLAHRLPPEERENLLADLDAQIRELATLNLAEVTETAINRVRMRAPSLTFDADLHPSTAHGRPGELERMIVNVLDNAAKFSPPATTVHIKLLADGESGTCTLTVADCGRGIDAAVRPHVFGRFYHAVAARSMPGSGLGLAIVAQTAAQHGGNVAV